MRFKIFEKKKIWASRFGQRSPPPLKGFLKILKRTGFMAIFRNARKRLESAILTFSFKISVKHFMWELEHLLFDNYLSMNMLRIVYEYLHYEDHDFISETFVYFPSPRANKFKVHMNKRVYGENKIVEYYAKTDEQYEVLICFFRFFRSKLNFHQKVSRWPPNQKMCLVLFIFVVFQKLVFI